MAELRLYFLGSPRVELDGAPVDLQRRKTLALLAYLAVSGKAHSRDTLAALLYPELDQQRARAYLRRDLAVLNTSLAGGAATGSAGWLAADRDTVELRRGPGLWLDVDQFRHLAAAGRSHPHPTATSCAACIPLLTEAVALYSGAFLAGFTLADSAEFDDWQFFQGESLRQELGALLQRLVTGLADEGSYAAAVPQARHWVSLDPLHETAQYHLIQLYGLAGQTAAALRQYEEFARLLAEELGATPETATTALYEAIKARRRLGSGRSAAAPAQVSDPAVRAVNPDSSREPAIQLRTQAAGKPPRAFHNLPPQATPFVGREKDLTAVEPLLGDTSFRLLTLVGPGGIGKTRLALEIARRSLEPQRFPLGEPAGEAAGFADGVFFVDLAAVSAGQGSAEHPMGAGQAADLVVTAIAAALEFAFQGTAGAKAQLLAHLRPQHMLLLLDNFEPLVAAGGLLAELLGAAPGLRLLVTSRERLNLAEERVWEVAGLAYPQEVWAPGTGDPSTSPIAGLLYYDAVAFFSLQAQRVRADFRLSPATAPSVLQLCRLVEGAPLALELAAGWLRALSCAEIVTEIERSLDFLAATTRSTSPRHRSLRAVFEQSWQMLSAPEQKVFSRLSLFQGGFQRAAAEVVAGASLPILISLVDKSLLRLAPAGRYHVHELVRQFAAEKLAETQGGASSAAEQRYREGYSAYYLELVAARTADLKGSTLQGALGTLRADLDNIRQAWQWAVAGGLVMPISAALDGLARFYDLTSHFAEGALVFGRAAADLAACAGPEVDPIAVRRLVGRLLVEQARLLNRRGLAEQGAQLMPQAVALAQGTGDTGLEALACHQWGDALVFLGQPIQAQALLEKALELARSTGQQVIEAETLRHLGNCRAYQGDPAGAVLAYYAALACFRRLQERRGEGEVLNNLASFQQRRGLWGEAAANYEQALRIFGEIGYRWGQEAVLNNLGTLHHDLGHYAEAQAFCLQGLEVATEIKNYWGAGHVLDTMGTIMRSLGDFVAAQSYYRQALELWRTFVSPYYESDTLAELALVLHLLGDDEAAYEYSRQAELIGRGVNSPRICAAALTHLGHAQLALGLGEEAAASYHQALTLCRSLNQAHFSREILAGLGRVALYAGDLARAYAYVAELLPQLTVEHLYGVREPLRIYLTCYQVLDASQDPRAAEVLAAAHQLLQERAAAITDERLRRCYLANNPAHRTISAAVTAVLPGAR
ncbi:MAG: tetratricopeptide repeat protein [Caldilineaceae bacterium]